jgi:hypothetical protein
MLDGGSGSCCPVVVVSVPVCCVDVDVVVRDGPVDVPCVVVLCVVRFSRVVVADGDPESGLELVQPAIAIVPRLERRARLDQSSGIIDGFQWRGKCFLLSRGDSWLADRGRFDERIEVFFFTPGLPGTVLSVELHCHSALSHDGRDPVDRLLEQAAAVGLDAIAVTDHDEIEASLEAVEMAPEYDLIGIPGMEVTSDAGHVLALGVEEIVPEGLSFLETLGRIRDLGGIAVVPHPFQESRHGVMAKVTPSELVAADAIEVYNSRLITGRSNRQAEKFARERGLPMTAGSDAHIAEMVGQAVTRIDAEEPTVEAILDAIREGRTTVEGKRTPWRISFRQAAGGAKRRVKHRLSGIWR